jgi:hypothetical protein
MASINELPLMDSLRLCRATSTGFLTGCGCDILLNYNKMNIQTYRAIQILPLQEFSSILPFLLMGPKMIALL